MEGGSVMDEGQKLTLLKQDLQMLTDSNDDYLQMLLEMAEGLIKREGITPENTTEYALSLIHISVL